MVDILVIDDNLTVTALDEDLTEGLEGGGIFDGIDLGTGHHAVAHLRLGEVEGVLEDTYLLTDLVFIAGTVDAGLHEVVEIDLRELVFLVVTTHADAEEAEQALGQQGGQAGYRIEDDIAHVGRNGEDGEQGVGVILKDGLRQELTREEHDHRGEQGVGHHTESVAERCKQGGIEETGEEDAVDD